ncbi:MAG: 3-oxoacyl-[acyl-carrier-protein] reductase FabG [Porticoccaceae bacterium]|nr:MAG: 3-oxoacyl-[acyl-carrier-protein] reductase FabG [Porticoccaceae bacterium]
MSLAGKIALVTGGSRGIGAAIADALGERGASVVATATTPEGAESITERFATRGVEGVGMVLDVRSADAVAALFEAVGERFGAPTILVNNAGITRDNLLLRMKDEEWQEVVDTNLNSVYRLCRHAVRGMARARWGRIVNIGSVVGAMGNVGQSNYAAAKAGLEGFTRALARELGSRNITVNTVAPGFVETDMTAKLPAEQRQALLSRIPLERFGRAEEIAEVVCFLVGDGGAYITGETIHVNGGLYMA